ncbi:MAG: Alpha/Beta hydrolase protein, partial [Olpidium bornovanus]
MRAGANNRGPTRMPPANRADAPITRRGPAEGTQSLLPTTARQKLPSPKTPPRAAPARCVRWSIRQMLARLRAAVASARQNFEFARPVARLPRPDVPEAPPAAPGSAVNGRRAGRGRGGAGSASGRRSSVLGSQHFARPGYNAPRLPIVLCHGLFGYAKLGPSFLPSMQLCYWGGIKEALEKLGATVIVTGVPGAGHVVDRARALNSRLESIFSRLAGEPGSKGSFEVNLVAHSMGGLDCRQLIAHERKRGFSVKSLTTVSTPHRGSPFADVCCELFGLSAACT